MIYRHERINNYDRHKIYFDDQMEAARFLQDHPSKWEAKGATSRKMATYDRNWDFNQGWDGVQHLARTGWSEGAKDLGDRLTVHMPENEHVAAWRYDVAGELPDVGRYLAGDPAHMRRHGHPKGHRPIISIFVNNWISCAVNGNQMANFGAALVAMIDQLENTGRRVELTAGTIAQHYRNRDIIMSASWKVKGAEDPLDLASVAFAIAHPGASRRFGWSLWERTDAPADSMFGCGLGPSATEDDLIDPYPGTLILPGLKHEPTRCKTLEDALKYAAEQINKAAGEELVTLEG